MARNDMNVHLFVMDKDERIAELEAKNKELAEIGIADHHEAMQERLENIRLREALKEYGRHHKDCPAWFAPYNGTCKCGFKQALKRRTQ